MDLEIGKVHAAIAARFKNAEVFPVGWSSDRTRFLFVILGPDVPTNWYLYDRSRHELSPLGESHPGLVGAKLGTTNWMPYKARDGLEIPAYVTLPPGIAKPPAPLPLIVLPHTGLRRDGFGFDYMAQFLATRGYAVLRPQYRGTTGLGEAFEKAGKGEWGGLMQTDMLDGVAALAKDGVIDPKRVCIVGDTVGGYAALAAATLHPEAYVCAAALSGASNLNVVLSGGGGAAFGDMRAALKAMPLHDPRYEAMSPSLHAANVRAPILLMWVDGDLESFPEQSVLMKKALAAAGKPFEELVLRDADHDMQTAAARTQMFEALETFLAKNLPATAP